MRYRVLAAALALLSVAAFVATQGVGP